MEAIEKKNTPSGVFIVLVVYISLVSLIHTVISIILVIQQKKNKDKSQAHLTPRKIQPFILHAAKMRAAPATAMANPAC